MNAQILNGRYRIDGELGRGGMGVVYRSWDTQLNRVVALKMLLPEFTHDQQFLLRFKSEINNTARLQHQYIVAIYDVGVDWETHYFVMQFIEGQDLKSYLEEMGRLTVDKAVQILTQIATALDYANENGIVHRDIKPENILIDNYMVARVTDFGIARSLEGTRMTGGMLGTPEYMSPEQAKGEAVDGRSDQYSLAIVAYEMLTGTTPFRSSTTQTWALVNMHITVAPPHPRQLASELPDHLCSALLRGLAKFPEERFPTNVQFIRGLIDPNCKPFIPTHPQAETTLATIENRLPAAQLLRVAFICTLALVVVILAGIWYYPKGFLYHTGNVTSLKSMPGQQPLSTNVVTPSAPLHDANVQPAQNISSQPIEENRPDYNVALHKQVTVHVSGNQADPGDGGDPQVITDGRLNYDGNNDRKSMNGVCGWVNHIDGNTITVQVQINLEGRYRISKINYNQGDVSRAATWNADTMMTLFGTIPTNPGGEFRGSWATQTGDKIISSLGITLKKTKQSWDTDWLFIGEIEVYGHKYNGE